jgi:hypothetical protein
MKVPYTKSGKCGNTVWQRNRYGQISYPWHKPKNPRTPAQQEVRGDFGRVAAYWRELTEGQRQLWGRSAKGKRTRVRLLQCGPMPAYNFFMQVNVALLYQGLSLVEYPPDYPHLLRSPVAILALIASFAPPVSQPRPKPLIQLRPIAQPKPQPELPGPAPPPSG